MKKSKLIASLSGVAAISLLGGHAVQADENPFSMQKIDHSMQLAEAGSKGREGKCGEGKCGAGKMQEGGCSGAMEKMQEGKCSEGKCGAGKMKEGGCSGSMSAPDSEQ